MILVYLVLFMHSLSFAVVKSKEEIVFNTPEKIALAKVGKIAEFKGVIERLNFKHTDLKFVDLYQFKTEKVKVSKELCTEYVEKIFGLKDSKLFEIKSLKMVDSNKGEICDVFVSDKIKPKKDAPYQRLVVVGFLNANPHVLVYHLQSFKNEKVEEARQFWNSLR